LIDPRAFAPANEADCLIENGGVAQGVYDLVMSMVEHAGGPGLKQLGICLAVPSVDDVEEDVLTTTRLLIVICVDEEEIAQICRYLDLEDQEVDQLLDGDTMLFDTHSDGAANFVRFRRAGIILTSKPVRSVVERQTEKLPEEAIQGGEPGLRTEEQK